MLLSLYTLMKISLSKRLEISDLKCEFISVQTGNKTILTIATKNTKQIHLLPENSDFEPIIITGNMTFIVWGVAL
jgi:hypothetical protein